MIKLLNYTWFIFLLALSMSSSHTSGLAAAQQIQIGGQQSITMDGASPERILRTQEVFCREGNFKFRVEQVLERERGQFQSRHLAKPVRLFLNDKRLKQPFGNLTIAGFDDIRWTGDLMVNCGTAATIEIGLRRTSGFDSGKDSGKLKCNDVEQRMLQIELRNLEITSAILGC
jgi:hypothetical protein